MPGTMENLSTVNSFLRTLIALVVIGGAGAAGWYGYTNYNAKEFESRKRARQLAEAEGQLLRVQQDLGEAAKEIALKAARIQEQETKIKDLNQQVDKLETSLTLLKADHRVAKLKVRDQNQDVSSGKMTTLVEFVEVNKEGDPIDTPRQFRIPGDTVFVDAWVVEFEDKYVEEADLERGTSLILFKRLFGNDQKPDDGYPLDEHGAD